MWRSPLLRNMAIALGLTNLAFAATESTFVLFATEELGVSTRMFGLLIAIVGAGSIAAGIAGSWLVHKVGRRFAILFTAFAPAVTMISIGVLPITWWVVLMTTVQAVMITIWSIIAVTLRQQIVPDHLFGRVNSVYRWFSWGAMPIGAFLGGLVAQRFGLRAPYFFGATFILVAYLMVVVHVTEPAIAAAMPASERLLEGDTNDTNDANDTNDTNDANDDDDTPPFLDRDPLDDLL
jgi:MFS family permease